MKSGFILLKGQTSEIPKVNLARHNFGYDDEDVLVITVDGRPVQMETLQGARNATGNQSLATLEEALATLTAE